MSAGIKCTACGHVSPIGRLFCAQCGAKLDVTLIVTGNEVSPAKRLYRGVRVLVLLALLLALVQMVRAVAPAGEPGGVDEAARLTDRLNRLFGGVQEGRAVQELIPEREINGYFSSLLQSDLEQASEPLVKMELKDFNVHVRTNGAVLVWSTVVGKLPVTYEVTGVPGIVDGAFVFDVQRIRVGHLPLPRAAHAWATGRLYQLFKNMEAERNLLNALSRIQTGDRQVLVRGGGSR